MRPGAHEARATPRRDGMVRRRAARSETSDADLALATAGGSWASIGTLYDRHRGEALAIARSVLVDPTDAEDVVHDTFVALPRMARSFDPRRGEFTHWLRRSVRNRAIDQARRQSRILRRMASAIDAVDILATLPDEAPSPNALVEAGELLDIVAMLDPRRGHLIRLAFVDGWTHPMIAALTGLPLGTVKSRIRSGLAELRDVIDGADASFGEPSRRPADRPLAPEVAELLERDDLPILRGDRLGRIRTATPAAAFLLGCAPRHLRGRFVTTLCRPHWQSERDWHRLVTDGQSDGAALIATASGSCVSVRFRTWLVPSLGFIGLYEADPAAPAATLHDESRS